MTDEDERPQRDPGDPSAPAHDRTEVRIAMLLFPGVTQLDLTGPAQVLTRVPGARVEYVAADLAPVPTDCGFSILPTTTLADASAADVLLVPGGDGAFDAMLDPAVVDFVRHEAEHATWVTSVCTGAFVLGAAGLLAGKRATTHWASRPLLAAFGADPVEERMVDDGSVVTAAGVSAGIDMALWLAGSWPGGPPPSASSCRSSTTRSRRSTTGRRHGRTPASWPRDARPPMPRAASG